ncbi:unnamed protein product, partial [Rotaria sp. Silwood1]
MDYMSGSDFVMLLNQYEMTGNSARFDCTAVILVLDTIHNMSYTHRDIKPNSILLDA